MTPRTNGESPTREEATRFLSAEFIMGLIFQTAVFLILGGIAWGSLKTEVEGVKEVQTASHMSESPMKIARIEEQLKTVSISQSEMKGDIKELVRSVDSLKDEVRRSRR